MLRDVAEPVDAGGLHGGVGVQALGDGVGDECLNHRANGDVTGGYIVVNAERLRGPV